MKYQNRILGMLALLSIITYVDRVCIAVTGPRMQQDLGISPQACSYNAPFVPMVATLCLGTLRWLTVDPKREVFEEERPLVEALA
jgi:hypothetical protein